MPVKNYRIAVVVGKAGLTEFQIAKLKQTIAETSKVVEGLCLHVPGFSLTAPEKTVDPALLQVERLPWSTQVTVSVTGFGGGPETETIAKWIKNCDEIVGFPTRSKKMWMTDRVWSLYRLFGQPKPGQPRMKIFEHWSGSAEVI